MDQMYPIFLSEKWMRYFEVIKTNDYVFNLKSFIHIKPNKIKLFLL